MSDTPKDETIRLLTDFVGAYGSWIDELVEKAKSLDECFKVSADKSISSCRDALNRMQQGIAKLTSDDESWIAFRLANRAMYMQREQLKMQADLSKVDRFPGDQAVVDR